LHELEEKLKRNRRRGFGSIRKLPSGRYQASFVTPNGGRQTAPLTFGAKVDAEGFLAQVRKEIDLGVWAKDDLKKTDSIQFSDFAIRHISLQNTHSGQRLKPSTTELYEKLLRGPLKRFDKQQLTDISKSDVDDWWIDVTAKGHRTTAAKAYKLMSAVFRRAVADGLVSSNPCAVPGAQSAKTGKKVGCPTPEQVAALAANLSSPHSLMMLLMSYGGLRFGEVTELRVGDLRLVESSGGTHYEISVTRAVTYVKKEFIVGTPKSAASVRRVPLTQMLNDQLTSFLDSFRINPSSTQLLFPSPLDSEKHLRNDVFAKKFKKAKSDAGITDTSITPHSLRHFGGTYFGSAGANMVELKEWLGDSSTEAAQRYLHSLGRSAAIAQNMPVAFE
jgi:integrase